MKPLVLIVIACTVSSGWTQQAPAPSSQSEVIPKEPFLRRAPDFSEWISTYDPSAAVKDKLSQNSMQLEETHVIKTKGIYHIQYRVGNQVRSDKWSVDGIQVTSSPNAQAPIVGGSHEADPTYEDLTKSDFFGLEWISKKNFVETKNLNGVDCIVFRDRIKDSLGESVDAEALIDLKTRLPVSLRVGDGLTTYLFRPAPTAQLSLPPEVAKLVDQWKMRRNQASLIAPP